MGKDFSFDIVSEVDMQEVDNAVNQAVKELRTRYDFKGSKCEIQFTREEKRLTLLADNDLRMKSLKEIIHSKFAKRGVSLKSLEYLPAEKAMDGMIRESAEIIQGIPQDRSKEIVKQIKEMKLKVQASIQGDRIRVAGRVKDELQQVMQMIRGAKLQIPVQFVNYR